MTPFGVNGKPYRFDMQNLRDNGTGVGCRSTTEDLELLGPQTTRLDDGTNGVTATQVIISPDGSTAENGETVTVASFLPEDDPAVQEARVSACSDTPVVGGHERSLRSLGISRRHVPC
ncbi:hypothetical protein [Homoserinimonas sp. OAct 916]|uniref:hypothetical protein n=1 Tax=Homoserinimonas sp. OAct 916 TaxID=2211450 RepID=UPI0013001896|nr:hypothetical protein [Homoserinimonas sp. OAct 916]